MHSCIFDFTIIFFHAPEHILYGTRFTEQIITEHILLDASEFDLVPMIRKNIGTKFIDSFLNGQKPNRQNLGILY